MHSSCDRHHCRSQHLPYFTHGFVASSGEQLPGLGIQLLKLLELLNVNPPLIFSIPGMRRDVLLRLPSIFRQFADHKFPSSTLMLKQLF